MAIRLSISVSEVNDVLLSFDVIRVKRSTSGIVGPYILITANSPEPAELIATVAGNYSIVSESLSLLIDQDALFTVVFTGTDPLTAAQVATQINDEAGKTIAFDDSGTLRLTSTTNGTGSKVEVAGGTAATDFGWTDDKVIGKDLHVDLEPDITSYFFTDKDGEAAFFYKTQFFNTTTLLESTDSPAFQGDTTTQISAANLSTAKVDLVGIDGIALVDQEISFYSQNTFLEVEGFQVGLGNPALTITTDNSGHAEVDLVRGALVKVAFQGTSVIREFTVPDAAEFDLLALLASAPDPFKIVDIQFPEAPRRSL